MLVLLLILGSGLPERMEGAEVASGAPDLSNMQERYDAPSWRRLSECVLAIELTTPLLPKVLPFRKAVGELLEKPPPAGERSEFFCSFSVEPSQAPEMARGQQWRRRESNPRPEAFGPSTLRA
jgi:hypothetical protein